MSDDERYREYLRALDAAGAVDRLTARLKRTTCPFCDNDEWIIEGSSGLFGLAPPEVSPVFVPKDTRAHFGGQPSVPALAFSCTNCGFVRLHNLTMLRDDGKA